MATHIFGTSQTKYGASWAEALAKTKIFFKKQRLLHCRAFAYSHSFSAQSRYFREEARLELKEKIDRLLELARALSTELTPAIGYCNTDIAHYPSGQKFNAVR